MEKLPHLKLDPSRSFLRPGDSVEVDCASSVGPHAKVSWERLGGASLPYNFRVSKDISISIHLHVDSSSWSIFQNLFEGSFKKTFKDLFSGILKIFLDLLRDHLLNFFVFNSLL